MGTRIVDLQRFPKGGVVNQRFHGVQVEETSGKLSRAGLRVHDEEIFGPVLTAMPFSDEADVVTMAKALGNGVPIGACLARGAAAGLFTAGSHGSTFGGNPLACRVGLAVIETLEQEQTELYEKMADESFYKDDGNDVAGAKARLAELEKLLEEAYGSWEKLETIREEYENK